MICGNSFSWNSRNKHGYGAILFNQIFYGMTFRESVQTLLDMQGTLSSSRINPNKIKTPFRYSFEQESKQTDVIKEYLNHERKIDGRIVDYSTKIKGFTSSKGSKFDAYLRVDVDVEKIAFDFNK